MAQNLYGGALLEKSCQSEHDRAGRNRLDPTRDAFLVELASEALSAVLAAARGYGRLDIALNCDEAIGNNCSISDDGVIDIGLPLLRNLDESAAKFGDYLVANLSMQISPLFTQRRPLDQLFSVDDFADKALRLYTPGWMDAAFAAYGTTTSIFQTLMEAVGVAKRSDIEYEHALDDLLKFPKPALNYRLHARSGGLVRYGADSESDRSVDLYRARIHLQLLGDATLFALAHECGHLIRERSEAALFVSSQLEEEIATDELALNLCRLVPGFMQRSLFTLFGFLQSFEQTCNEHSHPFSRHRLLALTCAATKVGSSGHLRRDMDAGLSLLESELGKAEFFFRWPDQQLEEVTVQVFQVARLGSAVDINCYLERVPRLFDQKTVEANLIWSVLCLNVTLSIHTLSEPDSPVSMVSALIRPSAGDIQPFLITEEGSVVSLARARIELSPDWWLNRPGLAVSITGIQVVAPDNRESLSHHIILPAIDDESALPLPPVLELSTEDLCLAARQYLSCGAPERSLRLFEWLWKHRQAEIDPVDAMTFATTLRHCAHGSDAAAVAETVVRLSPVWPPGAHLIMAQNLQASGDDRSAFDHAFFEWFGIGEFGPCVNEAQQLWLSIIKEGRHEAFSLLRTYFAYSMRANRSMRVLASMRRRLWLSMAVGAMNQTMLRWGQHSSALLQLGLEVSLELAREERRNLDAIQAQLQELAAREPKFAPPIVRLAEIALAKGETALAQNLCTQARRLAPMSEQAMRFEHQLSPSRNPFTATPATTKLLSWTERGSMLVGLRGRLARGVLPLVQFLTGLYISLYVRLRDARYRFTSRR